MATERRKRTSDYVGPKATVTRETLATLEATGEWVFEEKHDGFWCLAEVRDGWVVQMSSRVGLAFEGAEVAGILGEVVASAGSGRLVGELTADRTPTGERAGARRLHLFDAIDWNGHDLRDLPQTDRREALAMICGTLHEGVREIVRMVEQRAAGIPTWFDEIIARGGEGVVGKHRDTRYRAKNGDGKIEAWVRAKKKRTVDYVVVGHGVAEKGTPNLDLGLWKDLKDGRRIVKVLTVTLPPHWRGDPASLVGRVVEAEGWEIWTSGALRSAQIGHRPGPRDDKRPEDCTYGAAMEEA